MLRRTGSTIAAGVIAAGLLTAAGAGLATAAPSPTEGAKKPGPAAPCEVVGKPRAKKPYDSTFLKMARELGVTPQRLEQALINLKTAIGRNGGNTKDPALVTQFARDLGISTERAKAFLAKLLQGAPTDKAPDRAEVAKKLAAVLGISEKAAADLLKALEGLKDGINPESPEFLAIAKKAGVSPEDLAKALKAIKDGGGVKPAPGEGKGGKPKPGGEKDCKQVPKPKG